MVKQSQTEIQTWSVDKLVLYARNPRKNDAAVDRMCGSIREFGFKIPVLARSDGEVVDGHLRLKAARKLGITDVPVILCDEWSPAQVKAFRLMVNRSVTWADWDEELLALELQELNAADYGHRSAASGGTSRRRGALPGSGRLVRRTPDVREVRPKTGGENIALARRCLELIRDIAGRGALSWDPEQLGFALQELSQVLLERTGCDDRVFEPMPAGELNDLRRLYEELDFVDAASKDMQRPN